MAVWPSGLPQKFQQSGFSNSLPDNTIQSSMATGPDKARRRDVSAVEPISGSMILDETQYELIVTFYNTTLASGALPFDWVHPVTGIACEMRIVRPPKFTPLSGNFYKASMQMEIQP